MIQGSLVVIICSLLVQLTAVLTMKYLSSGELLLSSRVISLCFQGLMFLVYPLLGHLADVYLTRYRMLKCGIIAIVVGLLWFFVVTLTHTLKVIYKSLSNSQVMILGYINTTTPIQCVTGKVMETL